MKKFIPTMVMNIGRAIIIEKKNKILSIFFLKKNGEKKTKRRKK